MTTQLVDKLDRRAATAIVGESHVIGEDTPNLVFLYERPDAGTAVTIAGFTEIASGAPAAGEFRVVYAGDANDPAWGKVIFNATDEGTAISVDYDGLGADLFARDVNRIHSKLVGITTVADAATMTIDGHAAATQYLGPLTANRTIDAANVVDGLAILVLIAQDATGGHTVTWTVGDFDFGADGEPTLSTDPSVFDALGFVGRNGKWVFTGIRKGYAV